MIGICDVSVQAANPNMPLYPLRAFVNSPSSLRIRNVPKRIGDWNISSVQLVVTYPDNTVKTVECKLIGSVWVGTVSGSSVTGKCENGYTVFASGNDENGNPVLNYTLGKGLVEILEADADLKPGADIKYVRIFDEEPETPKDGDVWQTNGAWYIYQDGQSWPIGDDSGLIDQLSAELSTKQDVLTEQQLSVIDSAVDEMNTIVKFANDAISSYSVVGNLEYGTAIGWEMEAGSQITEVKLGNTVKRLMSRAFSDRNSLTRIEIPNSVTKLDEYSFVNCWNLSSINIPDSVSSIGEDVFDRNFKLSTLTIPKNVSNIGYAAFSFCSALTSVVFKDRTLDEVQAMADYPWYVSDVSVITTENNATQEWANAQLATKQDSLTLAQLSAVDSVVDERATIFDFGNGDISVFNLVGEITQQTMTDLGLYEPYDWIKPPVSVKVGTSVTNIGSYLFANFPSDFSITLPNTLTAIGDGAFQHVSCLNSIEIPDSVTTMGRDVLFNCSALTDVKIGSSLSSIARNCFERCSSLSTTNIPNNIKTIETYAFYNSGLTGITIPDSVTNIEDSVFSYCRNLQNVFVGAGVNDIGLSVFNSCESLSSVVFKGKTLNEVQAMQNYPWGIPSDKLGIISTENIATQEWVMNVLSTWLAEHAS